MDADEQNLMTKSDVLAPNNSEYKPDDQDEGDEKKTNFHFIEEGFEIYRWSEEAKKRKPIIHFKPRCNEVNRDYEGENNAAYDNGVANVSGHSLEEPPKADDKGKSGKKKKKGKEEVKDEEEEPEQSPQDDPNNPEFEPEIGISPQAIYEIRKLGYDASHDKDYLRAQVASNAHNYATAAYHLV